MCVCFFCSGSRRGRSAGERPAALGSLLILFGSGIRLGRSAGERSAVLGPLLLPSSEKLFMSRGSPGEPGAPIIQYLFYVTMSSSKRVGFDGCSKAGEGEGVF